MSRRSTACAATLGALLGVALGPGVAWAAPEGRIQEVRTTNGQVTYVLSAEGLGAGESIDPGSIRTTIGGVEAPTTAAAAAAEPAARPARTVMLVLDASGSMNEQAKLATAKRAATTYLDGLPADVRAGLVSFADSAKVEVRPTADRARVREAVASLEASGATALNDAVALSVKELGTAGSRNAVLLSDGQDEGSRTSAKQARASLAASGVVLDAVSLGEGTQQAALASFAKAGEGTLVTATDAAGLTAAFEQAARAVNSQLAVTAEVPQGVAVGTASLVSSASVGDAEISDTAAVIVRGGAAPTASPTPSTGPIAVAETEPSLIDHRWFLLAVVSMVFVALATITSLAVGAVDAKNRKSGRVSRRLQEVSLMGPAPGAATRQGSTVLGESTAVRRAVSFADRVAASRDTTAVARRLEEANITLRPGEWVVVHALIALLAGLLATLLSGLDLLVSLMAFGLGLVLPWVYLGTLASRRRARFYQALPDAMQMLAGSMSAGYSLPQALANVARESGGPLGEEVSRALMESRLGLPIEETMEASAQRMQSKDFHWVVMAIRINRKVGGNLAEVLTNVGKTLRERERLRRQVKTLSAEGKLSAWILGLLPIFLVGFMVLVRPEYIAPLLTQPIGWVILGAGLVAYVFGIVWMRNLINMEV